MMLPWNENQLKKLNGAISYYLKTQAIDHCVELEEVQSDIQQQQSYWLAKRLNLIEDKT